MPTGDQQSGLEFGRILGDRRYASSENAFIGVRSYPRRPTVSVPIHARRAPRFKRPSTPVSTDDEEDYPEEAPPPPGRSRDSPNKSPHQVMTRREACWMTASGHAEKHVG